MKVLDHGFVKLVQTTGHVGLATTNAARCSFGETSEEFGDRDAKLCRYLLDNGHTSPFRHAFFTFHVKAPLFVMRQWWKYQIGSTWRGYEIDGEPCAFDIQVDTDQGCSWNELSGRYKQMDPEFYLPAVARANDGRQSSVDAHELTAVMQQGLRMAYRKAIQEYEFLIEQGVAKELARLALPNSIYSECVWTVSLQAVLHFLEQRLKLDAQWEIRQYAGSILQLCKPQLSAMGIMP
tara:strand:+ start:2662 stop:3369 length:708 start_codon:yes stop_codon:yes gene_type:complete